MWTRKELKTRAKAAFKGNYWRCVLAALILAALIGGGASIAGGIGSSGIDTAETPSENERTIDSESGKLTLWLRNGSGIQAAPENGGRKWTTGNWDSLYNIAPSINYKFNITNAGSYYVRVNMSNPNASGDSFHVGIDGSYKQEIAGDPRTGVMEWQGNNNTISLSAGEHTITIFAREDGIVANQILLTTDLSNVPETGVLATPSDRALLSE